MRRQRETQVGHRRHRESQLCFTSSFPAADRHSHLLAKGIPVWQNCCCAKFASILDILVCANPIFGVADGCSTPVCNAN